MCSIGFEGEDADRVCQDMGFSGYGSIATGAESPMPFRLKTDPASLECDRYPSIDNCSISFLEEYYCGGQVYLECIENEPGEFCHSRTINNCGTKLLSQYSLQ